jgi:N5-(cytidine 5'-diphosphoramidyl)-L-glutamine hydrolase
MNNIVISAGIFLNKYNKLNFFYDEDTLKLMKDLNLSISPINNLGKVDHYFLKHSKGLILMGNGDISKIRNTKINQIRDKIEINLYKYFLKKNKPILLVCRGFQNIMNYHKIPLKKISGHVRTKHSLIINKSRFIKYKKMKVNSYHNYALYTLPKNFMPISIFRDNSIEIAEHKTKKILCLMFHPERKMSSQKQITSSLKRLFK